MRKIRDEFTTKTVRSDRRKGKALAQERKQVRAVKYAPTELRAA
ncbi:hypothetical protein SEA_YOSIF_74 [Streptomyces phage Yosif]|uniref:Uncharacterized protein n=1 Tax=Streptomyces phage Yosif TaxID=2201421 RepID=A0A2Z4QCE7_9CAUD|nr:hypothetical protein KGG71_gp74 [Streptomyces phage Yosif]AWY07638.1 hypothetical protein SEA_YOSIF_74 [Streptomyces phage Yosif]